MATDGDFHMATDTEIANQGFRIRVSLMPCSLPRLESQRIKKHQVPLWGMFPMGKSLGGKAR